MTLVQPVAAGSSVRPEGRPTAGGTGDNLTRRVTPEATIRQVAPVARDPIAATINWSWVRDGNHVRYYAKLPDGRHAYVAHKPATGLWEAYIVRRAGQRRDSSCPSAIRRLAKDCRQWVEKRYP